MHLRIAAGLHRRMATVAKGVQFTIEFARLDVEKGIVSRGNLLPVGEVPPVFHVPEGGDRSLFRQALRIVARKVKAGAAEVFIGAPPTTHEPSGLPMSQIMAIHEYGTATVPERAPFKKTMAAHRAEYKKGLERAAATAVNTKSLIDYERLGAKAVDDVQQTIRDRLSPALAESTVTATNKRSDVPLLDTANMLQAIDYEVQG